MVWGEKKRQWKLGPGFEGFAVRIAVRKIKDGRTSADLLGISCIRVLAQAGSAEARTIQAEGQIPQGCKLAQSHWLQQSHCSRLLLEVYPVVLAATGRANQSSTEHTGHGLVQERSGHLLGHKTPPPNLDRA